MKKTAKVHVVYLDFCWDKNGELILDKDRNPIIMARNEVSFIKQDKNMIGNLYRRYPTMTFMQVLKEV